MVYKSVQQYFRRHFMRGFGEARHCSTREGSRTDHLTAIRTQRLLSIPRPSHSMCCSLATPTRVRDYMTRLQDMTAYLVLPSV